MLWVDVKCWQAVNIWQELCVYGNGFYLDKRTESIRSECKIVTWKVY